MTIPDIFTWEFPPESLIVFPSGRNLCRLPELKWGIWMFLLQVKSCLHPTNHTHYIHRQSSQIWVQKCTSTVFLQVLVIQVMFPWSLTCSIIWSDLATISDKLLGPCSYIECSRLWKTPRWLQYLGKFVTSINLYELVNMHSANYRATVYGVWTEYQLGCRSS